MGDIERRLQCHAEIPLSQKLKQPRYGVHRILCLLTTALLQNVRDPFGSFREEILVGVSTTDSSRTITLSPVASNGLKHWPIGDLQPYLLKRLAG